MGITDSKDKKVTACITWQSCTAGRPKQPVIEGVTVWGPFFVRWNNPMFPLYQAINMAYFTPFITGRGAHLASKHLPKKKRQVPSLNHLGPSWPMSQEEFPMRHAPHRRSPSPGQEGFSRVWRLQKGQQKWQKLSHLAQEKHTLVFVQ